MFSPRNKYVAKIATLFLLLCPAFLPQAALAQDAQFSKGLSYYKGKNYAEAISCFNNSLKLKPRNPTALYYAALCYCGHGAKDQAKQVFQQIVEYYPQSQEAKLSSEYLNALSATAKNNIQTLNAPKVAHEDDISSLPDEVNIPFSKGLGGHLLIDGELNGRRMRMFFDTGANSCCFGQNSLDQAGVTEKATKEAGYASGVGGAVKIKTMIATIGAGNLQRRLPIIVQDNLFTPLLGQPFYEGYSYDIDNNAGIIRFKKQGSRSQSQSFDSVEIPYTEIGSSHIFVAAEIDGKKLPVCFDTGASGGITMSMTQLMAAGISLPSDIQPTRVSGVAGESFAYSFNARVVRVGPIQKTGLRITVLQGSLPFALIGEDFFGDRKYNIDKEKKVIRFSR